MGPSLSLFLSGSVYFKVFTLIEAATEKKGRKAEKRAARLKKNFVKLWWHRKAERMPKELKEVKYLITPYMISFTDPYIKIYKLINIFSKNILFGCLLVIWYLSVERKFFFRPCGIYLAENGRGGEVFGVEIATSHKSTNSAGKLFISVQIFSILRISFSNFKTEWEKEWNKIWRLKFTV